MSYFRDFKEGAVGFLVIGLGMAAMAAIAIVSIGGTHISLWFLLGLLLIPIVYGIMNAIMMNYP